MFEAADGFFLDLADTLAGEVELFADLFQRHCMFAAKAEIEADHIGFT